MFRCGYPGRGIEQSSVLAFLQLAGNPPEPAPGKRDLNDAAAGATVGDGVDFIDRWRRVGYFVDKTFRGARPGDIPIEQPTRFELIVNLKTAKALGVKIPNSILVQAIKVIEKADRDVPLSAR